MAVMCGVVGALSAFYHDSLDISNERHREIAAYRLVAKMPTIAAMSLNSQPANLSCTLTTPQLFRKLSTHDVWNCANPVRLALLWRKQWIGFFFYMRITNKMPLPLLLDLLDLQSEPICVYCSDCYSMGPVSRRRERSSMEMLQEIGDVSRIDEYVARAKDKEDPFRLMGFGHRVYKNFDPRARVMKEAADEVLQELGIENDPLLAIAKRLEEIALEDDYFISKKLYPNVDFYSGIILKAIGIPTSMFTVIFAVGRTVGWIAHWNEMISGNYRIGRPRQLYTGHAQRDFVPMEKRS